jgi:hypothetical protein
VCLAVDITSAQSSILFSSCCRTVCSKRQHITCERKNIKRYDVLITLVFFGRCSPFPGCHKWPSEISRTSNISSQAPNEKLVTSQSYSVPTVDHTTVFFDALEVHITSRVRWRNGNHGACPPSLSSSATSKEAVIDDDVDNSREVVGSLRSN